MNAVILDMGAHRNLKGHNMEESESQTSIAWQWRWDVLRSNMAAHTKLVLLVASFHGDADGSNIRPTLTTLSTLCSLDERTVKKARDAGKGWLKVSKEGRGRGKATEYKLTIPRETLTELAALTAKKGAPQVPFYGEKDASEVPFSDAKGGATGTLLSEKGGTGCPPLGEGFSGEKGAPGAVKGGAGRPPTCPVPVVVLNGDAGAAALLPVSRQPREVSHDELMAALLKASGNVCDPQRSFSLVVLSEPLMWMQNGCSLEEDICPVISATCHGRPAGSLKTWKYFRDAVFSARDTRLTTVAVSNTHIEINSVPVQSAQSIQQKPEHWADRKRRQSAVTRKVIDEFMKEDGDSHE